MHLTIYLKDKMRTIQFRGVNFTYPIRVYFNIQTIPMKIFLLGLLLMSGYATLKFFLENKMEGFFLFGFVFIFMLILNFAFRQPTLTIYPDKIISHQIGKDKELYWRDCDFTVNLEHYKKRQYHWLHFFDKKQHKNPTPLFIINIEKICFEKHNFGTDGNLLFFTQLREKGIK